MSLPKKRETTEEELTTADLAQGKRPAARDERPIPLAAVPPAGEKVQPATASIQNAADTPSLFPEAELGELRTKWGNIQAGFVDEPRKAVEQADGLVASAMKRLAEVFSEERSRLEQQWDRGDQVSTEDLRVTLQRYRSFFHRLLSV